MAETSVLAPVLERVEQDRRQGCPDRRPAATPAVGAGGLFAGIVERHGAIVLTENRRQHDELERRALEAVRAGLGRDYLAFAEGKRDRLVVSERPGRDEDAPARRLVGSTLVTTCRQRHDRAAPARRRRAQRTRARAHGQPRSPRARAARRSAEREFAAGDRIVCLRNSDRLGVKNGTRGTIERVDREAARTAMSLQTAATASSSAEAICGRQRPPRLRAHRATPARASRSTRLRAGIRRAAPPGVGLRRALPRARSETRLYVTGNPRERESHFHELDDRDPVARLASALEESAVERLAVDQRPLPSGPKHDARAEIERFKPSEMQRLEARLLGQQRLALSKVRTDAERKLADAERALERTGRFGRRRVKGALMSQIALQQATVRATDDRLNAVTERAGHIRDVSVLKKSAATAERSQAIRTPVENPSYPIDMDL